MNKINQLTEIHNSGKPYIIYKSKKGFDLYTNFSRKIVLNNKNINSFLNKKYKSKHKQTDLYIGFFGYELLNNLINIKTIVQCNFGFFVIFINSKNTRYLPYRLTKIKSKKILQLKLKSHKILAGQKVPYR